MRFRSATPTGRTGLSDSLQKTFGLGPALALAAFLVWSFFSILPWLMAPPGRAFAIREAWDTGAFWTIGAPALVLAQAVAGAMSRGRLWHQPLWTLGGHFAGMLLVHKSGASFGMLPVALMFIGLPAYLALLLAAFIGHAARKALGA